MNKDFENSLLKCVLKSSLVLKIVFIVLVLEFIIYFIAQTIYYENNTAVSKTLNTSICTNYFDSITTSISKRFYWLNSIFQPIASDNKDIFVYSAYFEQRFAGVMPTAVRIHALFKFDNVGPHGNMMFFKNHNNAQLVCKIIGEQQVIVTNASLLFSKYVDYFYRHATVQCDVDSVIKVLQVDRFIPISVSLGIKWLKFAKTTNYSKNLSTFDNLMNVSIIPPSKETDYIDHDKMKISACLKPLHHFDKSNRLIEYIETYAMLGVDTFYIYHLQVTPKVDQVLKWYTSRNGDVRFRNTSNGRLDRFILNIEVVNFKLPADVWQAIENSVLGRFSKVIYWWGQHMAENECLMRSVADGHTHAIPVDLDDIIVPLGSFFTIKDLMKDIYAKNSNSRFVNFKFSGKYFLPSVIYADNVNHANLETLTVMVTYGNNYYWNQFHIKYIGDLRYVITGGIHTVDVAMPNTTAYECNRTSEGILHHYRAMPTGDFLKLEPNKELVNDFTFLKYNTSLYRNAFQFALSQINNFTKTEIKHK